MAAYLETDHSYSMLCFCAFGFRDTNPRFWLDLFCTTIWTVRTGADVTNHLYIGCRNLCHMYFCNTMRLYLLFFPIFSQYLVNLWYVVRQMLPVLVYVFFWRCVKSPKFRVLFLLLLKLLVEVGVLVCCATPYNWLWLWLWLAPNDGYFCFVRNLFLGIMKISSFSFWSL